MKKLLSFIDQLENRSISLWQIALSLTAIIFLRNALEGVLEIQHLITCHKVVTTSRMFYFAHGLFFYFSFFLMHTLIVQLFVKQPYRKTVNAILLFFPLIMIVPLFDFFVTGGRWLFYPKSIAEVGMNLIHLFNFTRPLPSISIGQRWEGFFIWLLSLVYIGIKTRGEKKQTIKMILATFVIYLFFPIITHIPALVAYLAQHGFDFLHLFSHQQITVGQSDVFKKGAIIIGFQNKFSIFYIILTTLLLIPAYYQLNRQKFWAFIKNLRLFRLLHYLTLTSAGVFIGLKYAHLRYAWNLFDYIGLVGLYIGVILAWAAQIIFNDLEDTSIDAVSNRERPLIKKIFTKKEYLEIGILLGALSLFLTASIHYVTFLLTFLGFCLGYLYSNWPFRWKRFFLINTMIIGIEALLVVWYGSIPFFRMDLLSKFPTKLSLALLAVFTLASAIKDIKDYEGDKQDGVHTMMTVLGPKWGKIVTGILLASGYIVFPLILNESGLWIYSVIWGIISLGLVHLKKYTEQAIFLSYFVYAGIYVINFM